MDGEAGGMGASKQGRYKTILTRLHNEHILGDKEVKLAESSDIENNQYAIYDVDKDGQDELIVLFTTAANTLCPAHLTKLQLWRNPAIYPLQAHF